MHLGKHETTLTDAHTSNTHASTHSYTHTYAHMHTYPRTHTQAGTHPHTLPHPTPHPPPAAPIEVFLFHLIDKKIRDPGWKNVIPTETKILERGAR